MYYLQINKNSDQLTVNTRYNALDIWKAHQGDMEEAVSLTKRNSSVIVQKKEDEIWAKEI